MHVRAWANCEHDFQRAVSATDLANILLKHRDELATQSDALGGLGAMRAYSNLTDALIRRVFDIGLTEGLGSDASAIRRASEGIAVAAVGGYGRREMSPFSDVDVAFLVSGEEDPDVDRVV